MKKMKKRTRTLFMFIILLYLSGCALSDGEPSSSAEESGIPKADIDFLKSVRLASYDQDRYIFFEEDTLVVQVLSEKALNAEPSDGPLSIEETYDLEEFTDIEIETKEDTYYLTNDKEFEMQLKQLSDSVFQDGEGTRYMVQSN